jgi:predicted HicB family RNase H-like nuclease
MNGLMEYKGYYTNPRFSAEDNIFWGNLEGIDDSISFEGSTVDGLQSAFMEAVDDYLEICELNNIAPNIPYHGKIEVDIGPGIHKQLALYATDRNVSLNQAVVAAIKNLLTA